MTLNHLTAFRLFRREFIYFPLIVNVFVRAPDLAIASLNVVSDDLELVIINQGNAPVREALLQSGLEPRRLAAESWHTGLRSSRFSGAPAVTTVRCKNFTKSRATRTRTISSPRMSISAQYQILSQRSFCSLR